MTGLDPRPALRDRTRKPSVSTQGRHEESPSLSGAAGAKLLLVTFSLLIPSEVRSLKRPNVVEGPAFPFRLAPLWRYCLRRGPASLEELMTARISVPLCGASQDSPNPPSRSAGQHKKALHFNAG
jgi:hypothetical protein